MRFYGEGSYTRKWQPLEDHVDVNSFPRCVHCSHPEDPLLCAFTSSAVAFHYEMKDLTTSSQDLDLVYGFMERAAVCLRSVIQDKWIQLFHTQGITLAKECEPQIVVSTEWIHEATQGLRIQFSLLRGPQKPEDEIASIKAIAASITKDDSKAQETN